MPALLSSIIRKAGSLANFADRAEVEAKLESAQAEAAAARAEVTALSARLLALEGQSSDLRLEAASLRTGLQILDPVRAAHSGLGSGLRGDFYDRPDPGTNEQYWTGHNVTAHRSFASAEDSLSYLTYRNESYPGYIELLPYDRHDGLAVLDYGCGPGNDLVGFSVYSTPSRLVGVDISSSSLAQAGERLALHGKSAELIHLPHGRYDIPLPDASIDYVHCSGVLMLIEQPERTLAEFRRVLRPGGEIRLMVYNYDSIWVHLYVAFLIQVRNGLYATRTLREAFSRSTDGEYCPVVHVWSPADMDALAAKVGLKSEFIGAAMSLWEMHLLPRRFEAAMDERLNPESRSFLIDLTFDDRGNPLHQGRRAGIDACYRLTPA